MNSTKIAQNFRNKFRHECKTQDCKRAAFYDNKYCYKCFLELKNVGTFVGKMTRAEMNKMANVEDWGEKE